MAGEPNDFEVASKVSALISGMGKERQQKILRWVAESIDMPLGTVSPTGSPTPQPPLAGIGQGRAVDIKTFVATKNPRSDLQYAAVIAYYYRFEAPVNERKDTITAETLQESTRLAGRSRISAPKDALNNAKKQGYLDSVDRGQYRINTVGENLVAMSLPREAAAALPPRSARVKTPGKRKASGRPTKGAKRTRRKP